MSGFLIVFCTEIDIMIQISISIIFSWVVSLHSAPNYGHPSGPLFFPCGLQALRFNFWHREQGLTGFYISESFDPPCPWCVKPMSWRALILASFFSQQRELGTRFLSFWGPCSGSQSLSRKLNCCRACPRCLWGWFHEKDTNSFWNMITSVGLIWGFCPKNFRYYFHNHFFP